MMSGNFTWYLEYTWNLAYLKAWNIIQNVAVHTEWKIQDLIYDYVKILAWFCCIENHKLAFFCFCFFCYRAVRDRSKERWAAKLTFSFVVFSLLISEMNQFSLLISPRSLPVYAPWNVTPSSTGIKLYASISFFF